MTSYHPFAFYTHFFFVQQHQKFYLSLTFLTAIFHEISADNLKVAFRLYRGPLLIIEFIFLIGINVYGWRSSGVNHVLIFELDPRNHLSEQHLMELSAIFGVIWTLSLLSFLFSSSLSIPPYVNPLALTVLMFIFLLNPFKVFRHDARFWLLRTSVSLALGALPSVYHMTIIVFILTGANDSCAIFSCRIC